MSYNLTKGESYNLSKTLTKYYVGLGWKSKHDLDLICLLIGKNGKLLPSPNGVVFFNNPTYPSLSEQQWKDNSSKTGRNESAISLQPIWISPDEKEGHSDDVEFLHIDFKRVPEEVSQLLIAITFYDATATFGDASDAYIRIAPNETSKELARYDLVDKFTSETCLIFGKLTNDNGEWHFEAVGKANKMDLKELIDFFN